MRQGFRTHLLALRAYPEAHEPRCIVAVPYPTPFCDVVPSRGVDGAVDAAPRHGRPKFAAHVFDIDPVRSHHVALVALRAVVVGLVKIGVTAVKERQIFDRPLVTRLIHDARSGTIIVRPRPALHKVLAVVRR